MRTRSEIQTSGAVRDALILEILLDIRDILAPKQEDKQTDSQTCACGFKAKTAFGLSVHQRHCKAKK